MEVLDPKLPFRIDEKTSRGLLSVTNSINPEIIRAIHNEKVVISVRKDSLSFSESLIFSKSIDERLIFFMTSHQSVIQISLSQIFPGSSRPLRFHD